jgi:hypothetical protein
MRRAPIILASGVFFLWLGFAGTAAAFSPAQLAQPEGLLTLAQYDPGWRWRHPGWRWRHAYARSYVHPGWHRYPGWRWRHPGWRWGY